MQPIKIASREGEPLEIELHDEGIKVRIRFGPLALVATLDLATARELAHDILDMAAQAN